jgi:hypothetical protein
LIAPSAGRVPAWHRPGGVYPRPPAWGRTGPARAHAATMKTICKAVFIRFLSRLR